MLAHDIDIVQTFASLSDQEKNHLRQESN